MAQQGYSRGGIDWISRSAKNASHFSRSTWLLILGWCFVALFLSAAFTLIEGRAPTWEDELYPQSTAWSIVHGGPEGLSANGIYPQNGSLVRFYGPVSFTVAAALLRTFGLQTWPWRVVGFLVGTFLIVISSAFLLHVSGAGRWITLAGASVAAISTEFCSLLPGRWDPVTMGLILAGIAVLLHAADGSRRTLPLEALAAGLLFGLAVGSTPRALPPMAAVACGLAAGASIDAGRRVHLAILDFVAAISTLATDAALLAPLGMTPWSWAAFVRKVSKGDEINSSPLLGGTWNLGVTSYKTVVILTLVMVAAGFASAFAQRRRHAEAAKGLRVTLTTITLANMVMSLLLTSRFLSYAIFWLPLLAVSSFCWISWECTWGLTRRFVVASLVCLELLLPATLEIARMRAATKLWKGRDPQILLAEIRSHVPAGSIVFGPVGGYFFPVEQSGSRYLYLEDDILPGLDAGADSSVYRQLALDAAACTAPTFAVWWRVGNEDPLPDEIAIQSKIELSAGEAGSKEYPVIYRLVSPEKCPAMPFDADAIKPFKPL